MFQNLVLLCASKSVGSFQIIAYDGVQFRVSLRIVSCDWFFLNTNATQFWMALLYLFLVMRGGWSIETWSQ
jgi:hypothetical protein